MQVKWFILLLVLLIIGKPLLTAQGGLGVRVTDMDEFRYLLV